MRSREISDQDKKRVEAFRRTAQRYRTVFSGPDGERVLMDILNDLHHYDCEDPSHDVMILQIAARRMLAKMQVIHSDNLAAITSGYLSIPMPQLPEEMR